jgi:hypothetical protein
MLVDGRFLEHIERYPETLLISLGYILGLVVYEDYQDPRGKTRSSRSVFAVTIARWEAFHYIPPGLNFIIRSPFASRLTPRGEKGGRSAIDSVATTERERTEFTQQQKKIQTKDNTPGRTSSQNNTVVYFSPPVKETLLGRLH